jgi:hypothetical protein
MHTAVPCLQYAFKNINMKSQFINMKAAGRTSLLMLLLAVLMAGGCKKDFLDEPRPTQSVSDGDVFKTEDGVRSYLNGIYSNMRAQWAAIGTVSTGANTDAWGYNSINLARVNKGIDIINPGGWYQFDYRQENREPAYRRVRFTWQFLYEIINQTNVVVAGVEGSAGISASAKSRLTAEARALRGWLYFELAREFQFPITKDPNAPGVPVYTEPTTVANQGKPRGTLQEVFNQINDDLAYAIANIGTSRVYKSQINKPVVYGMIARVMLEQKKWAEAADAAAKARDGFSLDANAYPDGYGDMEGTTEVIWGFPQNTIGMQQTLYYGTPSSFYEKTGNGYDNFYVNSDLVASISLTDVRNTFYITNATPTNQRRYSTNKFGAPSADPITLINGQTVALKETDFNEDLPMMRIAEMYLVEAEARAELGQNTEARGVLYTLQKNRDPQAVASSNSGQALINEILLERRKEFYGELGLDFLDIKRRQLPYVRGGNHPTAYKFSFPANDNRMNLKIPQAELDTNEFISEADQNQ